MSLAKLVATNIAENAAVRDFVCDFIVPEMRLDGDLDSVTRGLAVFTRLTRADVNAVAVVDFDFDGLVTAVAANV